MDEPEEIEITVEDLPTDLTVGELNNYLLERYPNTYVRIFHSPIKRFGDLPPEILARILRSDEDIKPTSTFVSKTLLKAALPELYQNECMEPVTKREILNEVRLATEREERGEEWILSAMSIKIMDNGILLTWYSTFTDEDKTKIRLVLPLEIIWETEEKAKIVFTGAKSINKNDIDTDIDMFTERYILNGRTSCIRYDNYYYKKKLVERYNNEVAPDLNDEIRQEDVEATFMANHLAFGYGIVKKGMRGMTFDLSDQRETKRKLLPIFNEARIGLRDSILGLLDRIGTNESHVSEDNEYIIVL